MVVSKLSANSFVKKSTGKIKERYLIGKTLGEGGFGEVRFCRHKTTKEPRAVKFLRKSMLSEQDK
jgi:serine/threonine protein kinase